MTSTRPTGPVLASAIQCGECETVFDADVIPTLSATEPWQCPCGGMVVTLTGDGYAMARFSPTAGLWEYWVGEDNQKPNLIRLPQEE